MGVNALIRKVLGEVGINPDRFSLQWASAAEAPRFVKLITGFTQTVKDLGPLGSSEGFSPEEAAARIQMGLDLVSSQKIRVSFGNVTKSLRKDGNLTDAHIAEVVNDKMAVGISNSILESSLLAFLKVKSPATLTSLLKETGADKEAAEKILAGLEKKGKISLKGKKWAIASA